MGGELGAAFDAADLFDLVRVPVGELCVVDEDDVVRWFPVEGEEVLASAELSEIGDLGAEFLTDVADDRVTAGFVEFNPPMSRSGSVHVRTAIATSSMIRRR